MFYNIWCLKLAKKVDCRKWALGKLFHIPEIARFLFFLSRVISLSLCGYYHLSLILLVRQSWQLVYLFTFTIIIYQEAPSYLCTLATTRIAILHRAALNKWRGRELIGLAKDKINTYILLNQGKAYLTRTKELLPQEKGGAKTTTLYASKLSLQALLCYN